MKVGNFGKRVVVLVLASMVFGGSLYSQEPLTEQGSIVQSDIILNQEVSANGIQNLVNGITTLGTKIKDGTQDEVINASIDLALLAVNKLTNFSMEVTKDSTENAIKRRITAKLNDSILKGDSYKSVLKKGGLNVIKSLIIDTIITEVSEGVGRQTGNTALKEFTWLVMKNAEVAATSGGNPVSVAVGQAMILKDVAVKNIEATKELMKTYDDLKQSKQNGLKIDLEYEKVMGAIKYANSKDPEERMQIAENTFDKMEQLVLAGIDDGIVEESYKITYMDGFSQYFRKIDQERNNPPKEEPNKEKNTPIVDNDKKEELTPDEPKEEKTDLDKKKEADSVLAQNKQKAQEYETLYTELKKDPNNQELKKRVQEADSVLRESTENYIALRNQIRQSDSTYGELAYSRDSIRDRIDKQYPDVVVNYEEIPVQRDPNPDNQDDPNQAKLDKLSATNEELKSKIKSVNDKKNRLQSKENELENINQGIRDAYQRAQNADKDSDEYQYAINDWKSLARQKHSILAEINDLTNAINGYQTVIDNLQRDKNYQMTQIVDTVDDYLNSSKVDIAINNQHSTRPLTWLGTRTFNSEDKPTGTLRYWGGRFDSNLALAAEGGGGLINSDYGWTITNGEVKNIYVQQGTNTATDTTQEFYIGNSEISTDPSFYDTNINTLKIQKNLSNGNTLKFEATGHYEYTAWGDWAQTGGLITDINGGTGTEQMALHNNWAAGQETHDLPTHGSATYHGVVSGHWYQGNVGSAYGGKVNGTMAMSVDFSNTSVVSGTMNLHKVDGGAFATATMDQMQINRTEGGFAGRLIGPDIAAPQPSNNQVNGQFNGPNAEEISGIWNVDNTSGEHASGVFAGKR